MSPVPGRVAVTGAQGLLGRNVVRALLDADPRVRVLGLGRSPRRRDSFTHELRWLGASVPALLPECLRSIEDDPRYEYRPLDLAEPAALAPVLADFAPDAIVHAAAALRGDPLPALLRSNVLTTASLFEAIPPAAGPKVVFVSSGSVYGGVAPGRLPIRECEAREPPDLYAATKSAAEDVARVLAPQAGVPLAVARVFNLLGAGLQDRHLAASLAGQIAAIRSGASPPVLEVGPLGSTRDFVDVADAARGIALLVHAREAEGAYNVGSGRESRATEILEGLLRAAGLERASVEVSPLERRAGDYDRSVADVARLGALGYEPQVPLDASLEAMLAYYERLAGAVERPSPTA